MTFIYVFEKVLKIVISLDIASECHVKRAMTTIPINIAKKYGKNGMVNERKRKTWSTDEFVCYEIKLDCDVKCNTFTHYIHLLQILFNEVKSPYLFTS